MDKREYTVHEEPGSDKQDEDGEGDFGFQEAKTRENDGQDAAKDEGPPIAGELLKGFSVLEMPRHPAACGRRGSHDTDP